MHWIPVANALAQKPQRRLKFCCSGLIAEDWHVSVVGTHMRAEGGKLRRELERPVSEGQLRVVVGAGAMAHALSATPFALGCRWRIFHFSIEHGFKIDPESFTDWAKTLSMWGFDASGGCSFH